MMAEQKGRGGKKPKYQIADIGGSDLTPQDLSTERVLNFLIKGEAPAGQAASNGPEQTDPTLEQTTAGKGQEPADTSLPSSGSQGKKSLDHLFRRASAGGGAAKDLKLDLRGQVEPAPATEPVEIKTAEQTQPSPTAIQAEGEKGLVERPVGATTTRDELTPATPRASPSGEPEAQPQTAETKELTPEISMPTTVESTEFTQLVSLWKSFYRLKDGEINALSTMYQMSHSQGSDECYVKMQKLAEMSNLTYRYCQKVVRSLEQLGWITKIREYDSSTHLGVLYRINLKPTV